MQPHEPRHELVPRQRRERTELLHERVLLRCPIIPSPGRFKQRQAQKPFAVLGCEGKRRGTTGGVADEMETLEAMKVSLAENPFHLGIETKVRRWFVLRVDLEVFHNRLDTCSQHLQQRRERKLRR